jgi:hypothetical protein
VLVQVQVHVGGSIWRSTPGLEIVGQEFSVKRFRSRPFVCRLNDDMSISKPRP